MRNVSLIIFVVFLASCTSTRLSLPSDIQYEVSDADARKAIIKGMSKRGWKIENEIPGKIVAKVVVRTHVASTAIKYANGRINYSYAGSENLNCRKKGESCRSIHKKYNAWVNNLSLDISEEF